MRRLGLLSLLVFSLLAGRIAAAEPAQVDRAPDPGSPPIVWKSDAGAPRASDLLWQSSIGQAGSLTVCGDKVLVGGGTQYHPDAPDAMSGVMECLSSQTGRLLWRVKHDRIPQRVHDMVSCISSRPFVDGDRVYYVSNRGELCCVGLNDGRVLWMLDMPRELGVFKRDPMDILDLAPSPIVMGGVVYCVTGNGAVPLRQVPAPKAPSFVAVDKWTGKMIWSSNAPGSKIIYGQWSTPAQAIVDGMAQILFPGGDGALYGFEPQTGKQLWALDCHDPHDKADSLPDFITAPPLVAGQMAYVSPAVDMEFSNGPRRLLAIDLRADAIRWACSPENFTGTLGPMAESDGLLYAAGCRGIVVALNAESGKVAWSRDLEEGIHGGLCRDGKTLYVAASDSVFALATSTGQVVDKCKFPGLIRGTPVIAAGRLFVFSFDRVWAVRLPK